MNICHQLNSDDYIMTEASAWITAGNISIRIRKDNVGVVVELYPLNMEDGDPVASCDIAFADSETMAQQ